MKRLRELALFLVLLFLGALVHPLEAQAGARLFFDPEAGNYEVGDEFSVKLEIDPASQDVYAVDTLINYDSDKLSVKNVEVESYFTGPLGDQQGSQFKIDEDDASLLIYSFANILDISMNTVGTIATIDFEALAEGVASVTLACDSGVDGDTTIWPPEGDEITDCASVGSGSYTIGSGVADPTATPTDTGSGGAEPTASELPDSGIIEPLILTIVLGTLFVGLGFLGLIW